MKIGFYDSGLGGAKTLKDILDMGLTGEIYFLADTKNCPYGTKNVNELKEIIDNNIRYLIDIGCQIIVIACNTATSVAIKDLRKKYSDIIFIGTEPAIKVALDEEHKRILVLGTTRTIKGEKLKALVGDNKDIELVACDRLVTLIEKKDKEQIDNYLKELFSKYDLKDYSHIVLGCTHFPIVKDIINNIVGQNIKVIDGNIGIGNNILSKVNKEVYTNVHLIMTENNSIYLNNVKNILNKINLIVM